MGAGCDCAKNFSEEEDEFKIGQGVYSFKRIVNNNNKL